MGKFRVEVDTSEEGQVSSHGKRHHQTKGMTTRRRRRRTEKNGEGGKEGRREGGKEGRRGGEEERRRRRRRPNQITTTNITTTNNNTNWRGSVLTGEEPTPQYSGELNHALSQEGDPTQYQLTRQDTTSPWSTDNAGTSFVEPRYKCLKRHVLSQEEKKKHIFQENHNLENVKMKNMKKKRMKRGLKGVLFRDGSKTWFFLNVVRNREAISDKKQMKEKGYTP